MAERYRSRRRSCAGQELAAKAIRHAIEAQRKKLKSSEKPCEILAFETLTLRLAYMACEYFKADFGLAIVRPEHQAFYRRVFLHETIAEPRLVPGLAKPFGLMAADFPALHERVFERYPIMRSTAFERRMLFERPTDRLPSSDFVAAPEPTMVPHT